MSLRRSATTVAAAIAAAIPLCIAGAESPANASTTGPWMHLSPTKSTISVGQTVTLTVKMYTGTHSVNTAQVMLNFPDSLLDCSPPIQEFWPLSAAQRCTSYQADDAQGSNTPISGKTVFEKVVFLATAKGKAVIQFRNPGSDSFMVDAQTNTAVPATVNKAVIYVQ